MTPSTTRGLDLRPRPKASRLGSSLINCILFAPGTRGGELEGGGATYAASKAALVGLTKGIAHEGAPFVTANIVSPGPTVSTPRHARSEPDPPVVEHQGGGSDGTSEEVRLYHEANPSN